MTRSRVLVCALFVAAATLPSCGGDRRPKLTVSAASSLESAFKAYVSKARVDARQSFAGSDQLAAQIRQGIRPDVYAAANMKLPQQLRAEGLVERPVVFATNSLVLAVRAGSRIRGLRDLARPGTSIAIGAREVPVGAYTREALGRLPRAGRQAILARVRSEEPDVAGIVGKLREHAVDAGFVYLTDVLATHGELRAIALPGRLRPDVAYGVAVVSGARHEAQARKFILGLLHGPGTQALAEAGFKPPPE